VTVKLDVYNSTNSSYVGTLAAAYDIGFLDDLLIPGTGRFSVDVASTADLAMLTPRRWVRFRTGGSPGTGDIFGCVVQDRPAELASAIEPSSGNRISVVTFECPAGLSVLGYAQGGATLWPYGGLEGRQQNPRMFGWFTSDYDDSGWSNPVSGAQLGGPVSTPGWPDPQAVAFQALYPGDRTLYRRKLLAGVDAQTPARMYLVGSWGTRITVWLDGEVVLEKPANTRGLFTVDVEYEDIDHQLAIETVGGAGRMAWTWVRLVENLSDEGDPFTVGGVLRRTFDPADFTTSEPWYSFTGGFGWTGLAFDDSSWGGPHFDGALSTAGWPDGTAVAVLAPATRSRYRLTTTPAMSPTAATITVVGTYNTSVRVFVDSVEVLHKPDNRRGLFTASVTFDDSDQQIAVVVSGGGRWGLTWQADSDDAVLANTSTGYTWTYSADPGPGVTSGFVMKTAIDEAQARGDLSWITYDFTAAADSASEAWTLPFSRGFRLQGLGSLMDELSSIEGEPQMTPAGLLKMFVARGTDRTGTVTVSSPFSLSLSGRGPQATRWIYETNGGMGQLVNAAAETALGVRMEQHVSLGTDISPAEVGPVLVRQLERDGNVLDEVDVDLPDTVEPYVDVFLGDTVTCNGRGGTGPVRITSFELRVDNDNGFENWSATGEPVL